MLGAIKLACQLTAEFTINKGGQVPTRAHWPELPAIGQVQGKLLRWTLINTGASSYRGSLAFNLLTTALKMFMGMNFTNREEPQERASPTQHVFSPSPNPEIQPLPFILRPM